MKQQAKTLFTVFALLSVLTVGQDISYVLTTGAATGTATQVYDTVEGARSPHMYTNLLQLVQTSTPSFVTEQTYTHTIPSGIFTSTESIYKATGNFDFI